MAIILNIDTSQDTGLVALSDDGVVIKAITNETQKDHAAWIQRGIEKLFNETGYKLNDTAGVGVSNGPGSYTGLRIGLSTAKGLCYSLKIPLIAVGTLEVMALNAVQFLGLSAKSHVERELNDVLICPMIDARRTEVFTAVYDVHLNEVMKPQALVLDAAAFASMLERQKILFLGNGSQKFQQISQNVENAIFKNFPLNPSALASIIYRNFIGNNFAGLAYTEPLYLKEVYARRKED